MSDNVNIEAAFGQYLHESDARGESVSYSDWERGYQDGHAAQSERIARLEAALRDLVEAVEAADRDSLYAFQLAAQHEMPYAGRQYHEELKAAKAALEGK